MNAGNLNNRIRTALHPDLVSAPLRKRLTDSKPGERHHVIIEANTDFPSGLPAARKQILAEAQKIRTDATLRNIPDARHAFVFVWMDSMELETLLRRDFALASAHGSPRAIFKVWESARLEVLTTVSVRTVKASIAQSACAAMGEGVVWAVLDSGIRKDHPHFSRYATLAVQAPLKHESFVASNGALLDPLEDQFGHGTHVAGIIAGAAGDGSAPVAARQSFGEIGEPAYKLFPVPGICGMAPKCKLVSLRILDDSGSGDVISVINALERVMQINSGGSSPLIHGVNLSAGYLPDPESYGSGQSPICRQVDRAVQSGLVVVIAAGNYGYAAYNAVQSADVSVPWAAGEFASIADPGNACLAITVGSTHRAEPHRYGVSYFSSKGPTCDGRAKPDIVAPGERIISCASGQAKARIQELLSAEEHVSADGQPIAAGTASSTSAAATATPAPEPPAEFDYLEDTGTSMAAPHVSGVIAAFLSIHAEYIGDPASVAKILLSSATDLRRDGRLQGAGLVDAFRMIQAV